MGWDGMGGGQLVGIELVYAERVKGGGGWWLDGRRRWDGMGWWLDGLDGRGNGKWEMGNGRGGGVG